MTPVEELISWTLYQQGPYVENRRGRQWVDQCGDGRVRAEVDDLAAWLEKRNGRFFVDRHKDGWLCVNTTGQPFAADGAVLVRPTIRDALVAAVRKVADR